MTKRPVARKVTYTKGKSVKKTEPLYDPYFANHNQAKGVSETENTINGTNQKMWKVTPKWQRVKIPLKPTYTSRKKK